MEEEKKDNGTPSLTEPRKKRRRLLARGDSVPTLLWLASHTVGVAMNTMEEQSKAEVAEYLSSLGPEDPIRRSMCTVLTRTAQLALWNEYRIYQNCTQANRVMVAYGTIHPESRTNHGWHVTSRNVTVWHHGERLVYIELSDTHETDCNVLELAVRFVGPPPEPVFKIQPILMGRFIKPIRSSGQKQP